MATEKWIAGSGVGFTWTTAFSTATLNSIAFGNAILSDLQIDNTSALDIFCDVGIQLASITPAAPNFIGIYVYPLNQDGSTYGDGRFGSSAAGPPPPNYSVGSIGIQPSGTAVQEGTLVRIPLVAQKFKFVLYNQAGVALASSGNNFYYRTYNRSVA